MCCCMRDCHCMCATFLHRAMTACRHTDRHSACKEASMQAHNNTTHGCVNAYIHATRAQMHGHLHTYRHISIHTYIHTHIQASTHTYIDTGLHTCIHAYAYVYTHTDGWTDGRLPAELAEPKVGMLFSLLAANQVHGDDLTHGLQVIEQQLRKGIKKL